MSDRLRNLRLLPRDPQLGWTPFAWLVYLVPFVVSPYFADTSALEWIRTGAGLLAFLVLYFAGFWSAGGRLLLIIGGITAIGCLFLPTNAGAAVFFIYAASFSPWVRPSTSSAVRIITAIVMILIVQAVWMKIPIMAWGWGVVFAVLIGAISIHTAQTGRSNARLRMAQHEIATLAKTAERERIARDLHDVLGHTLSVIVVKSELASRLADREPSRAIEEIRDVERIARDALAQVRAAVTGYRAAGLENELESAAETLATASVRMEISRHGPASFADNEDAVLALVLREAITNVLRHSRASRCLVSIEADSSGRRLVIEDDGGARPAKEGMGITGMRERIEAIDGELAISYGSGMRLAIHLPPLASPEIRT